MKDIEKVGDQVGIGNIYIQKKVFYYYYYYYLFYFRNKITQGTGRW